MQTGIYSKNLARNKTLKIYSLVDWSNRKGFLNLGNKASSLIRLFQKGFDIPPSLFIDYSFFDYFSKTGLVAYGLVESIVNSRVGQVLAVRSSSNVEDSENESFAGFFKTVLNVPNNQEKIAQAITECYQSFPRAQLVDLLDKRKSGYNCLQMGVILQSMIDAKFSGILFTDSPQNPPTHSYRIEYCEGLGDKLTGSLLTGFSFVLDKSSGKIIQQEGNILLSQSNILSLWKCARNLEKKFHLPQDVEFVISRENDRVFLLQSRPITAFSYTPEHVVQKEREEIHKRFQEFFPKYHEQPILSNTNISELFPVATPLSYSIFKTIFAGTNDEMGAINAGRRLLGYATISRKEQTELFVTIGNQARTNLLIDALTFRLKGIKKSLYLKYAVKRYMEIMRRNIEKANYPEGETYLQAPSQDDCREYFGIDGLSYFKLYTSFLRNLRRQKIPTLMKTIENSLKKNNNYYRHESTVLLQHIGQIPLPDLKRKLKKYVEYLRRDVCVLYVILARIAFLSVFLIKKDLQRLSGQNWIDSFDNSETGSKEKFPHQAVDKLFELLLEYENCPDNFKMPNQYEFSSKVNAGEITLREFLQVFGHIGPLDIMQPRLGEMSKEMLKNLFQSSSYKPSKGRDEDLTKVMKFLTKYEALQPVQAREFKQWVKYAKIFMTLRETFKFEFLKIFSLIKMLVIEMQSQVGLNDLIYFLEYNELLSLGQKNLPRRRLLAMQRKAFQRACSLLKVKNVIYDSDDWHVSRATTAADPNDNRYKQVGGNTIHYGEAEGICLVARSTQEYYKKLIEFRDRGIKDIIGFFKGLEQSYCNLNQLNGIVTENGGYLAHAATLARENNIPYISNVSIDDFKDGYYIIFDTTNHKVIYQELI